MNDIYLIGEVGCEITLQSVIDMVAKTDKTKPLNVHIHSEGGAVYEGRAIYNYLKTLDAEVNTYAVGLVASIATIIFLAGKKRYAYSQNNVLIHLPMNIGIGNAKDLEATAKDLREEEIKLAKVYAEETDFTYDEAVALMNEDRMMSDEEIKKFGLTIKEYKAVAKFNNNNKRMEEVKLNKEDKGLINKLIDKISNKFAGNVKNKIVQDGSGAEIDFFELEEDATPKDGDKAKIEGSNANGEYVMPSGETYSFADGILTIVPKEDEEDEEDTEALKQEIATLKEQLQNSNKESKTVTAKLESIELDFTELKASFKGSFNYDAKDNKNKNKGEQKQSRSFYGKK